MKVRSGEIEAWLQIEAVVWAWSVEQGILPPLTRERVESLTHLILDRVLDSLLAGDAFLGEEPVKDEESVN